MRILRKFWAWWLVGLAVLGIGFAVVVPDFRDDRAASRNEGRTETWTVTEVRCVRWCRGWGTFTPDDGGPSRVRVELAGGGGTEPRDVGSRYPALDVGSSRPRVYVPGGGRARTTVWLAEAVAVGAGAWVVTIIAVLCYSLWPGGRDRARTRR